MTETIDAPPATALDLGQALSTLLRRYLEAARKVVDDLPGGPRGFQVLSVSAGRACHNQARIAESLGLDRTVMTYLIDDLEQAGMVVRRPDPADRRARQVVLTDHGQTMLVQASARLAEIERSVLGSLSDGEAVLFRGLLGRAVEGAPIDHSACAGPDLSTPC